MSCVVINALSAFVAFDAVPNSEPVIPPEAVNDPNIDKDPVKLWVSSELFPNAVEPEANATVMLVNEEDTI